eukprot:2726857-Amphidinium_carterae.2
MHVSCYDDTAVLIVREESSSLSAGRTLFPKNHDAVFKERMDLCSQFRLCTCPSGKCNVLFHQVDWQRNGGTTPPIHQMSAIY